MADVRVIHVAVCVDFAWYCGALAGEAEPKSAVCDPVQPFLPEIVLALKFEELHVVHCGLPFNEGSMANGVLLVKPIIGLDKIFVFAYNPLMPIKKKGGNAKLTIFVRIDPEMREKLDEIANRETRTISNVAYLAIAKYLEGK